MSVYSYQAPGLHVEHATEDSRGDQELIAAANQGDVEAFEALYRRHRDWVVALALRFTEDHALAADVLQETFLYFLSKFPGFQLTCQLHSFLYPVVRHASLAARRKAVRLQSDGSDLELLEDAGSEVGQSAGLELEGLSILLSHLSEEHREVVWLRFVDDLTLEEMSVALEVPLGTVKSRLHNALTLMRKDPRAQQYFLK